MSFNKWYKFQEILETVSLVAVSREKGREEKELEKFADENLRALGECIILDFEPFEISSTEIRNKAAAGENIENFVDEKVLHYVLSEGLYKK